MEKKLEPGEVVGLKSGSPDMTITEIDGNFASCVWHDDDKGMMRDQFPLVALLEVED